MNEEDAVDGARVVGLWLAAVVTGLAILEVLRDFSVAAQKTSGNSAVQLIAITAMIAAVVGLSVAIDQYLARNSWTRRRLARKRHFR